MLNKVDDGRNNRRERSLLQLHDEEDLLISHDVQAIPEKQAPSLLKVKEDTDPGKKCCRINWTILFMYTFVSAVSVSMLYFNLQIYKTYLGHNTFINTSLNSTKTTIFEREAGINADIDRFIHGYYQRIEKFNSKLQDLDNKLEEIKKDSQYTLDKIQLLSIKNVEDLELINNIENEQKKFVSEMKEYHNEVEIKNEHNLFISNNRNQQTTKIESIVWVFSENYEKDNQYLRQLYLNNIKTYAYKSSYQIKFVTKTNYPYFLSPVLLTKISSIFKVLERRLGEHDRTNLGDHFETIKKVLLMVAILYEHGGVILIDNIAITQPLNWLQDPLVLKSFSRFDPEMPPQVVSFHNYYYSDQKVTMSTEFKELYAFPNIERYFLAAIRKSEFVSKLIDRMTYILTSPSTIKNEISQKYKMGILKGDDPYYEFFYIAGHLVIQDKQKQLDLVSKQDKKLYAIDYYGLYTINSMVGPTKLGFYFKSEASAYISINLMDIKRKQFEEKAGPIKFFHLFDNYQQANQKMLEIRNGRHTILRGSFIHQIFFASQASSQRYLYDRAETVVSANKPWINLPKKVWIYLSEHSNSEISKLIIQNNFKMSKQSGFEVLTVNSKTISFYLSKDIMNDVIDQFRKSRFGRLQALREYTLMLCLLANQGGVFVDESYLFLESLNWLQNINQAKPQAMINRMGETPKMFLFHSNHQRNNYNYTFDPKMNSRADNHILFQKSFIAVENDSLIIDELVEQILKAISMTDEQLDRKFQQCGIRGEVQYKRNPQLLPMDLLKCIYINGIKEASSEDYVKETNPYNIWSLDGDFSIYKIRENTNYENAGHPENKLITNFAMYEAEQRIGPIFKLLRFDEHNINFLNNIYNSRGDQPYKIVNKQSIFSRYFLIKN